MAKPRRPRDLNQLATLIVDISIGKAVRPEDNDGKNPINKEIGRIGGLKGGRARAENLSPERRQEIAKKAAKIRWAKSK